ncbi:hypothetical protein PRIPAC_84100 [Pristionchus pacificus]|uniref:Uncharacterized protein n=1 Tax=Pristionchus pacificus TaxID=54126 RepID=A0A2A6BSH7_PRIPA|nr:hypothetical protein PRIPAC_84100 [Pristionchus pacificus]|eukprot:PDM68864.1 hypothetical protein PRIPAC_47166 [Pristionchus pacificus]
MNMPIVISTLENFKAQSSSGSTFFLLCQTLLDSNANSLILHKDDEIHSKFSSIEPTHVSIGRMNVAFSALGYLLFALILVGSHKKKIFKKYSDTVFLILVFLFAIDIFETAQTIYFNMPDQNSDVQAKRWASRFDIVTLPTTFWACTVSSSLFVFPYLSSVFVDGIVSIFRFVVHFCRKNARVTLSYVAFGIFLVVKALNFLAVNSLNYASYEHSFPRGVVPASVRNREGEGM